MLSAEEAIEKWTEPLVKELQSLPQQTSSTKATAVKPTSAKDRVWGIKVPKKLGDSAEAVAAQGTPVPKLLEAVISKDNAQPKTSGVAATDDAEMTTLPAPAETAQPAVVNQESKESQNQEKPLQEGDVRGVPGGGLHQKGEVEIVAALPAVSPKVESALSNPANSAAVSRQQESNTDMLQLEALKLGPAKAAAMNVTRAAMKIPKEWLSKMQKK